MSGDVTRQQALAHSGVEKAYGNSVLPSSNKLEAYGNSLMSYAIGGEHTTMPSCYMATASYHIAGIPKGKLRGLCITVTMYRHTETAS